MTSFADIAQIRSKAWLAHVQIRGDGVVRRGFLIEQSCESTYSLFIRPSITSCLRQIWRLNTERALKVLKTEQKAQSVDIC
jgi:hypothetical protein